MRTVGQAPEQLPRTPRRLVVPALGLRVLVVEDNPVNQLVATGLLESLGLEVEVADDGVAGIEALQGDHGFALVLMDCRMPGLDGFDATRAVRAAEAPGRRVPIIAMTASALEGERDRCLAAGMDDFLTKPVDPAELEDVVQRWARSAAPAPAAAPAPPPAPPAEADQQGGTHPGPTAPDGPAPGEAPVEAPVVDEDRRRLLAELVKDGESFFDRTARSFVSRIDGQVRDIRAALQAGDAHATFTSAHLVKGSALNLGLPRVSAAAAAVEDRAHAGSLDGVPAMLETLQAEVDAAVAELRRRLS